MNSDAIPEPDQMIADAIDGAEEIPDPLAGSGREDRSRSRRALHAGSAGGARRAQDGQPRRLRGAALATEESRMPGDGAR